MQWQEVVKVLQSFRRG